MDFLYLEKWVKKEYGIDLTAYKSNQLHRRIKSFATRVGAKNAEQFIDILQGDKSQKQKFLDFLTINVTEFFRNPDIFKDFEKNMKDYIAKNNRGIKIWSAACSIGSEPYSVAMLLKEINSRQSPKILATDIDATILKRAQEGCYTKLEVKNIKPELLNKYFTKSDDNYIINSDLKRMITFKRQDLILDNYEKDFDIIICRNVVIYFNQDVKDKIYRKFSASLKKGGLLFVGATESIYNYKDYGFEKASTFIYRKL